jgi:hypothetical protein
MIRSFGASSQGTTGPLEVVPLSKSQKVAKDLTPNNWHIKNRTKNELSFG